jgi:hypothetical protein
MIPEKSAPRFQETVRADVVEALVNLNSEACAARVQRTRRAMRAAALEMRERRLRQRRTLGLAVLVFLVMLLLLGPTLFEGIDAMVTGERFADLSAQVTILLVILLPAMLAALIASWKGHRVDYRRTV